MVSKTMLFGAVFLVCAVWTKNSSGSAIPMWEYLGRGEKVNRRHHITGFATKYTYSHILISNRFNHIRLQKLRDEWRLEEDLNNGPHLSLRI